MIFDAMQAIAAEGVAICDAHPDLEVFRSGLSTVSHVALKKLKLCVPCMMLFPLFPVDDLDNTSTCYHSYSPKTPRMIGCTIRLRLGKALNFEYNEDTQTGLFQRRDPREGLLSPVFDCPSLVQHRRALGY